MADFPTTPHYGLPGPWVDPKNPPIGGGLPLPGTGTVPGAAPGGGSNAIDLGGIAGSIGSAAGNVDWQSLLNTGLSFLKDKGAAALGYATSHPLEIAMAALAVQQASASAGASARAKELQTKALSAATDRWAAGAPLREKGMAGLMTPATRDLSAIFANDSNPFAKAQRRPLPGIGTPPTTGPTTQPLRPPIDTTPSVPGVLPPGMPGDPRKRPVLPASAVPVGTDLPALLRPASLTPFRRPLSAMGTV